MGHLEASAAAAGLASLLETPVLAGVVAVNSQLLRLYSARPSSVHAHAGFNCPPPPSWCYARRLNAHVVSLLDFSRGPGMFWMPTEVIGRSQCVCDDAGGCQVQMQSGRLSSFGFSGTITHGAFALSLSCAMKYGTVLFSRKVSLYRSSVVQPVTYSAIRHMTILSGKGDQVCSMSLLERSHIGHLSSSVHGVLCEHVVGSKILLPGVVYTELAFSLGMTSTDVAVLSSIAFVRPCVISSHTIAVLRWFKMRISLDSCGRFDIASHQIQITDMFITHVVGTI